MPLSATAPLRAAAALAVIASLAGPPGIIHAASASPPRPDPLDPQARVPAARHDALLERHRGVSADVPVGDWRAANDTVTRIGGWRTYLRQAARPDAPASAPAGASPRP